MGTGYAIAYRLGVTPWERAGEDAAEHFAALLDREEQDRSAPPGRAVDLGCGTGAHTIELAARGWDAVGVDSIARAVERARHREGAERARFLVADVTDLARSPLAPGVDFFLDVGCFHGLSDDQRARYGTGVTQLAAPGATLLLLAFKPGHRIGLPRGAGREDVQRALPEWTLLSAADADTSGMPRPLKGTAPAWFRLRR